MFCCCRNLRLDNNVLNGLPEGLLSLTSLTCISLRHNNFSNLPYRFGDLRFLQKLDLGENMLKTLPPTMVYTAVHPFCRLDVHAVLPLWSSGGTRQLLRHAIFVMPGHWHSRFQRDPLSGCYFRPHVALPVISWCFVCHAAAIYIVALFTFILLTRSRPKPVLPPPSRRFLLVPASSLRRELESFRTPAPRDKYARRRLLPFSRLEMA